MQDLVNSLMLCGSDLSGVINQVVPKEPEVQSTPAPACVSPLCTLSLSDCGSTTCDQTPDSYSLKSFPKIDSPYKGRSRWPASSATYFKRSLAATASPVICPKKSLSADAPVFTPSFAMPLASPFSQYSVAEEVWELPGLSLVEPPPMDRFVSPLRSDLPRQSILQRGLSNTSQCRQM